MSARVASSPNGNGVRASTSAASKGNPVSTDWILRRPSCVDVFDVLCTWGVLGIGDVITVQSPALQWLKRDGTSAHYPPSPVRATMWLYSPGYGVKISLIIYRVYSHEQHL